MCSGQEFVRHLSSTDPAHRNCLSKLLKDDIGFSCAHESCSLIWSSPDRKMSRLTIQPTHISPTRLLCTYQGHFQGYFCSSGYDPRAASFFSFLALGSCSTFTFRIFNNIQSSYQVIYLSKVQGLRSKCRSQILSSCLHHWQPISQPK